MKPIHAPATFHIKVFFFLPVPHIVCKWRTGSASAGGNDIRYIDVQYLGEKSISERTHLKHLKALSVSLFPFSSLLPPCLLVLGGVVIAFILKQVFD